MANQDLTPWRSGTLSPYGRDPFASFRQQMDRLFDDFFAPVAGEGRSFAGQNGGGAIWPQVDVSETEQAYTVTADLPGLSEKDIELNLAENALTISGEKRSERNEEDGGRRYSERSFGRFQRVIPFPAEVDADQVKASCKDGVLTITLPKNAKARDKTRRIEIQRAAGEQASAASGSGQ
jgi:HSP20 family protein